jgi:signal transduction histidine kinase
VETIRSETIKYCIGFTLIVGIFLIYMGIWSVSTGFKADQLLVSTMKAPLWATCALFLGGAIFSAVLNTKHSLAASWVLCVAVCLGIFIALLTYTKPYGAISFIVPVLFAIILFDRRQMALFTGLVLFLSAMIGTHFFSESLLQIDVVLPLALVLGIAVLYQLIIQEYSSTLDWYQQKYLTALRNEQIIRDNEVKLQRLVNSLNDYENYLTNTNNLLIKARDDAEKAKNVKQNFVQNVSHELRTPLNLIIGFSEATVNAPESYGEDDWNPYLKGDIDCIYRNSMHLKALIDDVLDLAALENTRYEIVSEDIDLNAIIREVVLVTTNRYTSKGLSLEMDLRDKALLVRADGVRIKQVLFNLLSNSIKYTTAGGVVVSSRKEGNDKALVTVEDTGKGIPEEDLGKVFDAFYQVDKALNREDTGTGLGLSISKQLIDLHGGQMWISSTIGKGTAVSFTLPCVD